MNAAGWKFYNKKLLKYNIDGPALLLGNNFEGHVPEEGVRVVDEEACATVVPLPLRLPAAGRWGNGTTKGTN
eukprot:jgi/Phyca11/117006/e_gw1.32.444.1